MDQNTHGMEAARVKEKHRKTASKVAQGGPRQEPMENDGRGLYPAVDRDRLERKKERKNKLCSFIRLNNTL